MDLGGVKLFFKDLQTFYLFFRFILSYIDVWNLDQGVVEELKASIHRDGLLFSPPSFPIL